MAGRTPGLAFDAVPLDRVAVVAMVVGINPNAGLPPVDANVPTEKMFVGITTEIIGGVGIKKSLTVLIEAVVGPPVRWFARLRGRTEAKSEERGALGHGTLRRVRIVDEGGGTEEIHLQSRKQREAARGVL